MKNLDVTATTSVTNLPLGGHRSVFILLGG